MNTRNLGKYNRGYYKKLSSVGYIQEANIIYSKKKETKSINITSLIKIINYNVLSKLYSSRKLSPTIAFKIAIDNKVFEHLKEVYKFDSKYKESEAFIRNNNIKTTRCTNIRYYRVAQSFHLKINIGRKLKYSEIRDNKVCTGYASSQSTLSVQFFRICKP